VTHGTAHRSLGVYGTMGGDGGTITSKRKFLRTVGKAGDAGVEKGGAATEDPSEIIVHRLGRCAMSTELLVEPVVACRLGRLYNKTAVLQFLLRSKEDRKKLHGGSFHHIRKLKDTKELRLTKKPGDDGTLPAPFCWKCPVTGVEMNGKIPFCVSWASGDVYSKSAVQKVPEACGDTSGGLVWLAPSASDEEKMREMLKVQKVAEKGGDGPRIKKKQKVARE
jgi:hypothetical protein